MMQMLRGLEKDLPAGIDLAKAFDKLADNNRKNDADGRKKQILAENREIKKRLKPVTDLIEERLLRSLDKIYVVLANVIGRTLLILKRIWAKFTKDEEGYQHALLEEQYIQEELCSVIEEKWPQLTITVRGSSEEPYFGISAISKTKTLLSCNDEITLEQELFNISENIQKQLEEAREWILSDENYKKITEISWKLTTYYGY